VRAMRLRSRLNITPSLPMATMADVAFLLIIFFMLTSTFARDTGLNIVLPKALSSEKWVKPEDLMGVLQRELGDARVKAVTIRGDERVPYGTIVTVMDTAKLLGAEITLAAEIETKLPTRGWKAFGGEP